MVDKVDTKLSPVDDKNDKSTSIKRSEEPHSEVVTTQSENCNSTVLPMSSFHTQEAVSRKVEDKPAKSFTDINKNITPLSPVANNMRQPTRNDPAPVGKSKSNGHHEEPFSPDGFTQFEKV